MQGKTTLASQRDSFVEGLGNGNPQGEGYRFRIAEAIPLDLEDPKQTQRGGWRCCRHVKAHSLREAPLSAAPRLLSLGGFMRS